MFNSPLLDVTIGLVFIFLLYSLLVTSINEAIATLLSIRARMLKRAIITGMLSDTSTDSQLISLLKGLYNSTGAKHLVETLKAILNPAKVVSQPASDGNFIKRYFSNLLTLVSKKTPVKNPKLGHLFYDHPIIKNYGSSRLFASPSYIPTQNVSSVIVDLLKTDFAEKITDAKLQNSADIVKIKELLNYYRQHYEIGNLIKQEVCYIEKETLQILLKYADDCNYNITLFTQQIENWYDDTMKRVSGWYKRQIQGILFGLGLLIAVIFNVDTIKIANKLSVDKDVRDKMIQMAITAADKYKDDPRIKKTYSPAGIIMDTSKANRDTSVAVFKEYQAKLDSVRKILDGDLKNTNQILALGWDLDTKTKTDSLKVSRNSDSALFRMVTQCALSPKLINANTAGAARNNQADSLKNKATSAETDSLRQLVTLLQENECPNITRVTKVDTSLLRAGIISFHVQRHYYWYESALFILKNSFKGSAFIGFLITAFAISLGAPFWFDLLNKLIKIRGAGKKENNTEGSVATAAPPANAQQNTPATIINVNKPQQTGEEAVG